jgi:hypothetical protein
MCPTPTGRIHTRVAIFGLPVVVAGIVSLITGEVEWLVLVGLYLLIGITLDTALYSWLLRYQPPWMTFVLAVGELGILIAVAQLVELKNITVLESIIFYIVVWTLAIWTKVVILPIASLTYLESAGEFRRIQWSIPPSQVSVPVLASAAEAKAGPGPLVRSVSGVHATPLERKPSPSGAHAIPQA